MWSTVSLVSVVVPTYDRAGFLEDAIESVLQQTFSELECIVVDGGSTDGTRGILESCADSRLVPIYRDRPRGVSSARNAGIDAASGEYVLFLDSDDHLEPTAIATLVETLSRRSERYAGVCTAHERVYADGRTEIHRVPEGTITWADIADGHAWLGGPSCTMYRASVLDRTGGFDESFPAVEDVDLHLTVLADYDMLGLPDVLCVKNVHGNQMTDDLELMARGYERLLDKHGEAFSPRARAERHYTISHLQARRGQAANARSALRAAIRTYPWRPAYAFYYASLLLGAPGYDLAEDVTDRLRQIAR